METLAEIGVEATSITMPTRFPVKRGVKQGCIISPYRFYIFVVMVTTEPLDDFNGDAIEDMWLSNLRYVKAKVKLK